MKGYWNFRIKPDKSQSQNELIKMESYLNFIKFAATNVRLQ